MRTSGNKVVNIVISVFSLLVGLALLGGGIYMTSQNIDRVSGGLMIGIGILLCIMFGFAAYLIVRFDKLREEAEARAEKDKAEVYAFIEAKKREAELLRRGKNAEKAQTDKMHSENSEKADYENADGENEDENSDGIESGVISDGDEDVL
ncbi:MAG: hypothetical protein ACLUE6_00885 [Acutalibacteraceae bacterium]